MDRIVVVGSSGAGKTTLAGALADHLGVPHVEIDALHWEPGWTQATAAMLRERVSRAIAGDRWTIDGNYSVVRPLIWDRADTIIWLDYPMSVVFTRVFRRRDSLFLWVINTWRKRRRDYPKMLRAEAARGKRVLRFRTPAETDRWLADLKCNPLVNRQMAKIFPGKLSTR
jgi:adenylate kinase family enzyme